MSKEPEIISAIRYICDEKGLSMDVVVSTIEAALAAAYRKDFGEGNQNIVVELDQESGDYRVFDIKTVVQDFSEEELEAQREELKEIREQIQEARASGEDAPVAPEDSEKTYYNPKMHLMLTEAKEVKTSAEEGEEIRTELDVPEDFGRMAAQTAKQVITQKLREAERATVFEDYKEKEGEIVIGVVQRREGRNILIDLGRTTGIMPPDEQIYGERYNSGQRLKVYIVAVEMGSKGPQIRLSRSNENIVRQLFTLEIPEISSDIIEIKSIAREAGSRSKVAVFTEDESIDPIGACVGQRGTRVQTIINELGGEKVDIIEWSEEVKTYITNALSPAKVTSMEIDEEKKVANVKVEDDQLSLAIGRSGQNVRLASKLTGFNINIEGATPKEEKEQSDEEQTDAVEPSEEEEVKAEGEIEETTTEAKEETPEKEDSEASEETSDADKK